jgi:hypothetical protein
VCVVYYPRVCTTRVELVSYGGALLRLRDVCVDERFVSQ